ncbi:hypothetical protein DL98DRAFT_579680 [Cadophora sp. DSE1049]|nr:hypothetical protein DL98DRAFT_579680 [Cadophora sp. DSE1049]
MLAVRSQWAGWSNPAANGKTLLWTTSFPLIQTFTNDLEAGRASVLPSLPSLPTTTQTIPLLPGLKVPNAARCLRGDPGFSAHPLHPSYSCYYPYLITCTPNSSRNLNSVTQALLLPIEEYIKLTKLCASAVQNELGSVDDKMEIFQSWTNSP